MAKWLLMIWIQSNAPGSAIQPAIVVEKRDTHAQCIEDGPKWSIEGPYHVVEWKCIDARR